MNWYKIAQTVDQVPKIKSFPVDGKPFEFQYLRNKEKSPQMGDLYGQHIEPHGPYMSETNDPSHAMNSFPGKFESGNIRFDNPLVIEFGGGYQEKTNWKHVLSNRFGGKTGKALSQAVRDAGFDGIVTIEPVSKKNRTAHTSEIVDLRYLKPSNKR